MIYSQAALLMLRVFSLVQEAAMRPDDREERMKVARITGDVQIGALFPIHQRISGSDSCGAIWEQYGIHRTEIALKTVDDINRNANILPNVKLGMDIRDSCWTERIAMEQTIEFIRDALGQNTNGNANGETCCGSDNGACQPGATQQSSTANAAKGRKTARNLAAVVGPGSSAVTIAVQNLLQVFRIPQIGYSATSTTLSDKTEFSHFMRVVPSDAWQAKAMVEIVKHFGWRYVAVVYSHGNYGEKGYEELARLFEHEEGTCIAVALKIKSIDPMEAYETLLHTIASELPRPRVVLCFCEGQTNQMIFRAIKVGFGWIRGGCWDF